MKLLPQNQGAWFFNWQKRRQAGRLPYTAEFRPGGAASSMKRPVGRSGMTLIEVVLAAAILAAGMTALVVAASRCLAVMRTAKRYQDVQWTLSMGELEHPLLMKPDFSPDDWVVDGEEYDNDMTYSREVEEPDEEQQDGLYTVRSRVTWSEKGIEGFEEVTQLVFVKEKAEL